MREGGGGGVGELLVNRWCGRELAARTSRAVAKAGSERAWVSWARKRGPVVPSFERNSTDGLGDGGDVIFVEGGLEGGAAVAGGAEGDALGGEAGVGVELVEGGDETGDVDEGCGEGEPAGGVDWGAHREEIDLEMGRLYENQCMRRGPDLAGGWRDGEGTG